MKFFSDKLDIKRDNLEIRFNCDEQKYMAYSPDGIPVFNLNSSSEKILGKRNKELLMNPELLIKEMRASIDVSRYAKLRELGFPCISFEVLFSARDTDVISLEMSDYLSKLTSEEDVLIGIHRTGDASLDDIANILRYGLVMSKLNGNATNSPIHLMNNVSYYPNNKTIIKELVNADSYKNSLGAILIRIPDEDLAKNIFMIDSETGEFILDPLYVIGFVPVEENGHISEIITLYPPYSGKPFKELDSLYDDRKYARDKKLSVTKK